MPRNRRVVLIVAAAVVVALVAALTGWLLTRDRDAVLPSSGASATADPSATATATATSAPVPAPDPTTHAPAVTPAPADPQATPAVPVVPGDARGDVEVVVTFAGWNTLSGSVEAGAYAPVVESDGQCVLALTRDGASVTADHAAVADVSTTACADLATTPGALAPGTWTGTVSYSSSTSVGVSDPFSVEVP